MNLLRLYIPLKGHKQRVSTQVYISTLCTTLETCVKQYGEAKHWPSRGSVLFIGGRKFRGSINFMWGALRFYSDLHRNESHIFYSFKTELNIYIFVIFFLFILFKEIFFLHAHFHVSRIFFGDLRIIITRCWTINIYDHYAMGKCLRIVTK